MNFIVEVFLLACVTIEHVIAINPDAPYEGVQVIEVSGTADCEKVHVYTPPAVSPVDVEVVDGRYTAVLELREKVECEDRIKIYASCIGMPGCWTGDQVRNVNCDCARSMLAIRQLIETGVLKREDFKEALDRVSKKVSS